MSIRFDLPGGKFANIVYSFGDGAQAGSRGSYGHGLPSRRVVPTRHRVLPRHRLLPGPRVPLRSAVAYPGGISY